MSISASLLCNWFFLKDLKPSSETFGRKGWARLIPCYLWNCLWAVCWEWRRGREERALQMATVRNGCPGNEIESLKEGKKFQRFQVWAPPWLHTSSLCHTQALPDLFLASHGVCGQREGAGDRTRCLTLQTRISESWAELPMSLVSELIPWISVLLWSLSLSFSLSIF